MIKSHHLYPFFPDLIENQRRSVQYFWEKGLLEEFELFSYILGKKKNLQMILHGSKFMIQRPKYNLEQAVKKQKSYSVSLFVPIEFKWFEVNRSRQKRDSEESSARSAINSFNNAIRPTDSDSLQGIALLSNETARETTNEATNRGKKWFDLAKRSVAGTQSKLVKNGSELQRSETQLLSASREIALRGHQHSEVIELALRAQKSKILPVFLGDIPLMTERGSFLINGSARVLVNQIVRCPSVYFKVKIDHKNRRTYIASFLSDYGSWLRLETDYKSRIWVRIDKSQRVSIYALLRSLGFPESFLEYQLKYYSFLFASRENYYTLSPNDAIQYLWKKLTPGRWNSIQGCYGFLYNKFFNPRRYSIGPVGRLRLNKRLNRKVHKYIGDTQAWHSAVPQHPNEVLSFDSPSLLVLGEKKRKIVAGSCASRPAGVKKTGPYLPTLTPEDIFMALDLLIQLHYGEGYLDDIDHLKNRRVRLPGELIQNQFRLALSRITQIATEKMSKFEIENDLMDRKSFQGFTGIKKEAQSDSLKNVIERTVRPRSASTARSALSMKSPIPLFSSGAGASQQQPMKSFFQSQVFGSSIRELFHTSQLSQYMDQTNPLAEITHKRRLSSLGPGGIGRDQAGFAVREIHPSHFGRICPIETPEGPNAGLVGSLASYARITENGFLQSPYLKASNAGHQVSQQILGSQSVLSRATPADGRGNLREAQGNKSSEWFLFSADVEDESYICSENGTIDRGSEIATSARKRDGYLAAEVGMASAMHPESRPLTTTNVTYNISLAQSADEAQVAISNQRRPLGNAPTSFDGTSSNARPKLFPTRFKQEFLIVEKNQIEFFAVSPIQMISLATSLIPFLEHDDANRALMGSNMQRQAVPLLFAEKPLVGTGLEIQAARDSSTTLLVKHTGQVTYVDGSEIIVRRAVDVSGSRYLSCVSQSNDATPAAPKGTKKPETLPIDNGNGEGAEAQLPMQGALSNFDVYTLQNYWRSNQNTCLRQRPQVQQGEWVEKGDLLADGSATQHGEIALGKNILLAYMPWEGYNFEDAIVINERLVQEDIYTSIHIDRYDIEVRETSYGKEKITRELPYINKEQTRNIDPHGIIFPGTWVEEGDILVGKITPISPPKPTPEYRLLLAIFETKPLPFKETSLRVPQGVEGRVLDCIIEYEPGTRNVTKSTKTASKADSKADTSGLEPGLGEGSQYAVALQRVPPTLPQDLHGPVLEQALPKAEQFASQKSLNNLTHSPKHLHELSFVPIPQKVQIFLAHKRKIQLGDKMSGRHGNKGIVSLILPPQDMPFLQDGTPIDIVLNPLGVPSRMNVGQVLECLFGLAGHYLKQNYRLLPFDEMYGVDASRGLVYKKLYEASCRIGYEWLFDPNSPGKSHLFDGRNGEVFHQPILVGYSYMFKLIHLVDEKMHARSTGPYSLVTQQPLGGRSKHGGQRLGEMEVWALEGFGAASILQEFLTVKSDEIYARNTFLFHLMKRRKLPRPGLPESFRVLVHELQALCLSVYYNPDFRLTYPSLIGWDGLFLLSSKKFPTLQELSHLKNI